MTEKEKPQLSLIGRVVFEYHARLDFPPVLKMYKDYSAFDGM